VIDQVSSVCWMKARSSECQLHCRPS
jgi:hypothetical protein